MFLIIIVHVFPHEEEGIRARTSVFSSSSITSAMSQVVQFYITGILAFLTITDDIGASCDHSF